MVKLQMFGLFVKDKNIYVRAHIYIHGQPSPGSHGLALPHLNGTCAWTEIPTLPTEHCLIMLQGTYVLGLTAQQVVLSLARLTGGEKNNRPHFVQYAV